MKERREFGGGVWEVELGEKVIQKMVTMMEDGCQRGTD
jgi:hypothetical protein